jgi:hypothetical protein
LALHWRSAEDLREWAEATLRTLLCHASHHVPHCRRLCANAGVTPDDVRSLKTFCALPITSKRDLRAHCPDGVVADNLPCQRRRFATTSPKVVVTDSETLTPSEAEQIASVFRYPVVVHYECYELQSVA